MGRQQKAEALLARAERLEASLARRIKALEPDLIERFSATVLELGVIDQEQLHRIFAAATAPSLASAYADFAQDSSAKEGLPLALGRVQQAGESAAASLIVDLSEKARITLRGTIETAVQDGWSTQRLARAIRNDIGLTQAQSRWVKNFEAKLRISPAQALANQLRDRRFDPSLLKGDLSEEKIQRMVQRYRDRWINYRARLIARQELIRASNTANYLTWTDADERGHIPGHIRKFWWHSHDHSVRSAHVEIPILNPHGVAISAAFVTPLGPLRYPLDPMGTAENTEGCRCVAVFETSNPEART